MKKKQPLPYFPLWARDWLTSPTVRGMSSVQRGAFIDLLAVDWDNDGLPDEDAKCLGYLARDASPDDLAVVLREFVDKHADTGRRTHPKQNAERAQIAEYRKKQSERGKKGGRPPANPDESRNKPGDNQPLSSGLTPGLEKAENEKPDETRNKAEKKPPNPNPNPNDYVLLEKEPKGDGVAAPAVGVGIAAFVSPSIGEPFTANDNPAPISTNDEAFAAFLAAGPKLERPAPAEDDRPAKKAKAKKADEPLPPLPFPSEAFAKAWADFVDMRNRNRWKLTPRAVEIIFADLTGMGEAKAIMALQNSTVKSWRGVFEPTERRYGGRAAEVARQANGKISTGIDYSKP